MINGFTPQNQPRLQRPPSAGEAARGDARDSATRIDREGQWTTPQRINRDGEWETPMHIGRSGDWIG